MIGAAHPSASEATAWRCHQGPALHARRCWLRRSVLSMGHFSVEDNGEGDAVGAGEPGGMVRTQGRDAVIGSADQVAGVASAALRGVPALLARLAFTSGEAGYRVGDGHGGCRS